MTAQITVTVRLFAMLRERAGWQRKPLALPPGATVADGWAAVTGEAPGLEPYTSVVRFAINGRYATPADPLADADELAVIPPVAGGAAEADGPEAPPAELPRLELTAAPLADDLLAELRRTLPTPADGALALFVGQTRETPGPPSPGEAVAAQLAGTPVEALEYEAYEEMALDVLGQIASEIDQRFGVARLAIIHRVGTVGLGEASVVIAAAAAHREAAFDACRYAIEQLKQRAPIWKRERYADGAVWVSANQTAPEPPQGHRR